MATNKIRGPIIDPGLCRCCRSIKKCRLLNNEYEFMGQKEVYSDMIMDCFGILLSHIEDNDRDSCVCATCVVRLRDALNFRRQVLQSEELFLQSKLQVDKDVDVDKLKAIALKLEAKLKSDPDSLPALKADDLQQAMQEADLFYQDSFADFDDMADIKSPKLSPPHEPPPEVLTQPCPSDEDDDLPLILKAKKRKGDRDRKGKGKKLGKKAKEKRRKKSVEIKAEIEAQTTEKKDTTDRDLDYMAEENLLTLIEYSYVCPFKNRRNNYYCYYCKDYYPKPEDLRDHTVTHDTKPFQLLMGYKKLPKLDITRIDCRLCDQKIDDINIFKYHIEQAHGKKIYHEARDKLLLYKLTWNNLVCVTCNDVFEDFNTLNNHMTEHFSNFTCDVCGVSFLEKTRLDAHLKRHKDNEQHTCEICGKVFKSNHYKDMHVDIVHKKKAIIRCPKCDECFMSYALKNKHLTDVHGQKRVYPCNLCDKVYNRQKTLTEHQRRNHQKVMKHQCEYCEQRFYLPSRLKEHIATHTGERNFRCEHCDKTYPRLKSLQYHLRTHTNDRRYRCHVCGQGFIQNTSLKSHLKNHHPECDLEGCYF